MMMMMMMMTIMIITIITFLKLCTEYIDPRTIEPILDKRLIPLDKGEGPVHPIGVGEVIRRVIE